MREEIKLMMVTALLSVFINFATPILIKMRNQAKVYTCQKEKTHSDNILACSYLKCGCPWCLCKVRSSSHLVSTN